MTCPEITELLSPYLDNALSEKESQAVSRHLGECATCREKLQELQEVVNALKALPELEPPPGFHQAFLQRLDTVEVPGVKRRWYNRAPPAWLPLGAAAAVLMLVALSSSNGLLSTKSGQDYMAAVTRDSASRAVEQAPRAPMAVPGQESLQSAPSPTPPSAGFGAAPQELQVSILSADVPLGKGGGGEPASQPEATAVLKDAAEKAPASENGVEAASAPAPSADLPSPSAADGGRASASVMEGFTGLTRNVNLSVLDLDQSIEGISRAAAGLEGQVSVSRDGALIGVVIDLPSRNLEALLASVSGIGQVQTEAESINSLDLETAKKKEAIQTLTNEIVSLQDVLKNPKPEEEKALLEEISRLQTALRNEEASLAELERMAEKATVTITLLLQQ